MRASTAWLCIAATVMSCTAVRAETVALDTDIVAVTVYADRALVTRGGTAAVPKGVSELSIGKLPAWIDTGSIRAELSPRGAAEIVEIQVRKEFLATPDDAKLQAAEKAVRETHEQLRSIGDELELLKARREQVEALASFSSEKLPRDAVTRDIPVAHLKELVEFVNEERRAIVKRTRELEGQRLDLGPETEARSKRLAELRKLVRLEHASIVITVEASDAASLSVVARYMTPGATWEPEHEMRLDEEGAVRFMSFARIQQTTGENWNGARVSVSTQSPGKALNIPKLDALLVGNILKRPLAQTTVQVDTFAAANANFVGNNQWMNPANGIVVGQRGLDDYAKNAKAQVRRQAESIAIFERLQERGTTAIFEVAGQKAIRSDGTPVRSMIGNQLLRSTPLLVAVPEVSLNTTRTVSLTNKGQQPILPGKVSLYLAGAFVGTTSVDFVGTGEVFSMFAGLADAVKVDRVMDHSRSRITRGSRTTRIAAAFVTTIENLSAKPITLRLVDRVPVSDEKSIKVSGIDVDPKAKPGDDGLLSWTLTLPAKGRQRVLLAYSVQYPSDLGRLQKQATQSLSAPASSEMLIMDLESKF